MFLWGDRASRHCTGPQRVGGSRIVSGCRSHRRIGFGEGGASCSSLFIQWRLTVPRPRPYSNLGSAELVKELFDAVFEQDAAKYEDVRYEIEGGEDNYAGRTGLRFIKVPLLEGAQRVFDRDA